MNERELAKAITGLTQATVSFHAWLQASSPTKSISLLTSAVIAQTEQRKNEFDWLKSVIGLATKQDLKEMEKRLTDAIAKSASITPSVETAAMKVQKALDKLDATIPDRKKTYDITTTGDAA